MSGAQQNYHWMVARRIVLIGWGLACCCAARISAAQADFEQALDDFPSNRWYDRQSGHYLPPQIRPAQDEPLRQIGWKGELPSTSPTTSQSTDWDWSAWFPDLSGWLGWFPNLVFLLLGIALLAMVAALTYYSLKGYLPQRFEGSGSRGALGIDASRVVDLPFEVQTVATHPLHRAEELMRAGDYDKAIVFLLAYLLLALDQSRQILLQKGKTNRMYLRELQDQVELRSIVRAVVQLFEASYFGKHPIARERFAEVWQQLDEFHRLLSQVPAAADAARKLVEVSA